MTARHPNWPPDQPSRRPPAEWWPLTIGWVLERRKRGLWHRFLIWVSR